MDEATTEFHQVVNIKTYVDDYNNDDGTLVSIYIRADKFYDKYSRTTNDILKLLGDLGGLQTFFMLIGSVMVGFVSQQLMISDIVKRIFHIRKYDNVIYEAKKK